MSIMGKILVAGLALCVLGGGIPLAQASSLTLKNKQVLNAKKIEWREATRDYLLTAEGASRAIPEDQVLQLNIDRPADFDKAKNWVGSRQYAQAIPLLEAVARDYKKLVWDLEALKLQAECYVEMNEPKKAAQVMDTLFASGGTLTPASQMLYWKAIQKSGDIKRLQKELARTLGTGPSELVAAAYLIRGNAYLQEGDQEAALSDFLKIVTLFKGEKAVQPEALYNVVELLDKAKDPRAAEFRKILVNDYKNSEFAAKVQPAAK